MKVIRSTAFPEGPSDAKVDYVRVECSMEPTKQQGKILFEFSTSDVDQEDICREFVSANVALSQASFYYYEKV